MKTKWMERPRISDKLCRFLVYAVLAEVVVFGFLFTFWPGIYRMIARSL